MPWEQVTVNSGIGYLTHTASLPLTPVTEDEAHQTAFPRKTSHAENINVPG